MRRELAFVHNNSQLITLMAITKDVDLFLGKDVDGDILACFEYKGEIITSLYRLILSLLFNSYSKIWISSTFSLHHRIVSFLFRRRDYFVYYDDGWSTYGMIKGPIEYKSWHMLLGRRFAKISKLNSPYNCSMFGVGYLFYPNLNSEFGRTAKRIDMRSWEECLGVLAKGLPDRSVGSFTLVVGSKYGEVECFCKDTDISFQNLLYKPHPRAESETQLATDFNFLAINDSLPIEVYVIKYHDLIEKVVSTESTLLLHVMEHFKLEYIFCNSKSNNFRRMVS